MMRRLAILPMLLLAGCATGPTLEQRLLPFIGQSEGELVTALGVPERTYETEGRKFLAYEERRSYLMPDPYWPRPYGFGRRFGPPWSPGPYYVTRTCDITFTLRGGRVESFAARGDGCR